MSRDTCALNPVPTLSGGGARGCGAGGGRGGQRAESFAQEELPNGGDYTVLHTAEHSRRGARGGGGSSHATLDGETEPEDPADWVGWEVVVRAGRHIAGVVLLRRKYIPDTGFLFQVLWHALSPPLPHLSASHHGVGEEG